MALTTSFALPLSGASAPLSWWIHKPDALAVAVCSGPARKEVCAGELLVDAGAKGGVL